MQEISLAERRWLHVLLALTAISLFLLLHPYRGIVHDGHLYTLQALNKVFPQLYGNDVFLRFGSQDSYTIFPSLHAWAISRLGVETAAAAITLGSILLFLAGAFLLARALSTTLQGWFALILLLIVPADYGPNNVFHYIEEFVTPRQLAGALIAFALWAWLKNHRAIGAGLATSAILIHPIIALPGVLLLATVDWIVPHWRRLGPMAVVVALLASAAVLGWIPLARWQFDPEWQELALSRVYLSLANWELDAWRRFITVAATLVVAATTLESRQREMSVATLAVCGGLLLLALIGGDVLKLVIVVQAQPWRALWLATFLAVLLLPPVWMTLWRRGGLHRGCVLLLAASWASPDPVVGLGLAPLALLSLWSAEHSGPGRYHRLVLGGSWLVIAIVVIHSLADGLLALEGGLTRVRSLPPALDRMATAALEGVVPLLLILAGYGLLRVGSRATPVAIAACMATFAAFLCLASGRTWANVDYPQPVREAFSGWQELIPEGRDVLWLPNDKNVGQDAFHTWYLLGRPSFLSRTQASNALFSRGAAIEMKHRDESLRGLLPAPLLFEQEAPEVARPLRLDPVCRHSAVRYVVSAEPIADAQGIALPRSAGINFNSYKLYICP